MAYLTQSYLTLKGLEQICCAGIFLFLHAQAWEVERIVHQNEDVQGK